MVAAVTVMHFPVLLQVDQAVAVELATPPWHSMRDSLQIKQVSPGGLPTALQAVVRRVTVTSAEVAAAAQVDQAAAVAALINRAGVAVAVLV